MKFFNKMQVPVVERAELASRAGYAINKMIWDIVAAMVRQINSMIESLLSPLNADVSIWTTGVILEIYLDYRIDGAGKRKVLRHDLGSVPKDYVILDRKALRSVTAAGSAFDGNKTLLFQRSPYPGDAWTDTTITIFPTENAADYNAYFKVLLLP